MSRWATANDWLSGLAGDANGLLPYYVACRDLDRQKARLGDYTPGGLCYGKTIYVKGFLRVKPWENRVTTVNRTSQDYFRG